ncbi:MAG: hypothetical protein M3P51_09770 [Chloroflexota bacterium]|nr:hypothetical protein [Chloroflexota bacterium]
MSHAEWFRRSTWTAEDKADFTARLKRSRGSSNRAQYLRIQALHLQEIGTEALLQAALGLLNQLITDYPDPLQLASAFHQRAQCLSDLGRYPEALESYRSAFVARRAMPNVHDDAYLDFGELVLALRRSDLYDEALSALEEFGGDEMFPAHRYQAAMIRALIADERGDSTTARRYAEEALKAADATQSPFRYHRKLGLVRFVLPDVFARLRALAAA